ncbi:killer cell lectin like receptor F2 [Phyllostomus discolor]|uniref:Killer cell lectin like receptor F2 n=1 Tax=Phyllostomus discolor TaxID=89673 RepID=A0A834ARI0_9CHIR|nr:killer cell lectin like receptor F2 [Phyllostomus discolor]
MGGTQQLAQAGSGCGTAVASKQEFMQKNLKPGHPSWIGLYIMHPGKQWMWINECPFVEQKDFSVIGLTESMNCAVTTGNQVSSEDCDSKFYGICQRDVV